MGKDHLFSESLCDTSPRQATTSLPSVIVLCESSKLGLVMGVVHRDGRAAPISGTELSRAHCWIHAIVGRSDMALRQSSTTSLCRIARLILNDFLLKQHSISRPKHLFAMAPMLKRPGGVDAEMAGHRKRGYLERMKEDTEAAVTRAAHKPPVPRAADVHPTRATYTYLLRPDDALANRLGNSPLYFSFAVKTHGWPEQAPGGGKGDISRIGGFYTLASGELIAHARLVQLGWAWGCEGSTCPAKMAMVSPAGFIIEEQATKAHRITQAMAECTGRPIREVLREFMSDLIKAAHKGARVVAHHMGFHAAIVAEELLRSGLSDEHAAFHRLASQGLCLMSPELGRWLRRCKNMELGPETVKHTLSFAEAARILSVCEEEPLMASASDDASVTARVTLALGLEAVERVFVARALAVVDTEVDRARAPLVLAGRLGSPSEIIGFDIETHGWPTKENNRMHRGQFGWHTTRDAEVLDFARIVSIGWSICRTDVGARSSVKTALVQPSDFTIAEKATNVHKIAHDSARLHGRPLEGVLREFLADVTDSHARGGRLCAHHFEEHFFCM